jgi:hypothetical protein
MNVFSDVSELRCYKCGVTITLHGTIFDDTQYYNQQGQTSSHKKYDDKGHYRKHSNEIQAKGNITIVDEHLDQIDKCALRDYTKNGKLRRMDNMRCAQVRRWLKETGRTEYNRKVPTIRKLITGRHGKSIVPPQLTVEEDNDFLADFSQIMIHYVEVVKDPEILRKIGKSKVHNKPYYPYIIFKIYLKRLHHDKRLWGLLECIHLQSDTTLVRNDIIWEGICKRMKGSGYKYKPTDRTLLLNINS